MTARARAREELTREITEAARRQLAARGPTALSVRAVARELGMASSAVYRYFPSRDDLLTALIVEGYDAVGAAAEAAAAEGGEATPLERFLAVCRAVRRWALDHPHEYALLYGTPVPGYRAPVDTTGPAARVGLALLATIDPTVAAPGAPPPAAVAADLDRLRPDMGDRTDATLTRALLVWTALFGTISFELFGHYRHAVDTDPDAWFDHALSVVVVELGLMPPAW